MSECTTCPDATVDSVPTGPIKCGCCGEPLFITCLGKCDPIHVANALAPKRPRPEPRKLTFRRKACAGCPNDFTPKGGRDNFCEACKAKR